MCYNLEALRYGLNLIYVNGCHLSLVCKLEANEFDARYGGPQAPVCRPRLKIILGQVGK